MATYTNLDTIQRPVTALIAPPSWGAQVNDNFTTLATHYQARMYRAAAFTSIANWQLLQCDTAAFDPYSCLTLGASAKYTCPVNGYYWVTEMIHTQATAALRLIVGIYHNGAEAARGQDFQSTSATYVGGQAADLIKCNAGDTLQPYFYTSVAMGLFVAPAFNNFMVQLESTF